MINEVPAIARTKALESLVDIHSDPGIVSSLMMEVQLPDNETPIQVDSGPNNRLSLWADARQCISYEPPWRLLNEEDAKVIPR